MAGLAPPRLVVHADWSVDPRKRWMCVAAHDGEVGYRVHAPEPVGDLATLIDRLRRRAGRSGPVLFGFDFPLGLPAAYAARAGIEDFRAALPSFGEGPWARFYDVCAAPAEIALLRPFYPLRSGAARREHLAAGLGLAYADLLRVADRPTGPRRAASVMFWTLGGQQVGKGALAGWRQLVAPALRRDAGAVAVWPFDGRLDDLLGRAAVVLAECYPAEYYHRHHLDLPQLRGKRRQAVRRANGERLAALARDSGLWLAPGLRRALADGFGETGDGEDRFDAVVGTFGILNVVLGHRPLWEPDDPVLRRVEGWTLGQGP